MEGRRALSCWIVGNDGKGSAFAQPLTQPVGIVGAVGRADPGGWHLSEEGERRPGVAHLPWRYFEGEEAALCVAKSVDFGRAPATRPANRLLGLPPFPPAAER